MIFVFLGGGAGACSRYLLAGLVARLMPVAFPWGTFVVNMLGCLAYGLVWAILERRAAISPQVGLATLTGFMGSFTTFSTFAFESNGLLEEGRLLALAGYAGGQLLLGLAAVMAGIWLAGLIEA